MKKFLSILAAFVLCFGVTTTSYAAAAGYSANRQISVVEKDPSTMAYNYRTPWATKEMYNLLVATYSYPDQIPSSAYFGITYQIDGANFFTEVTQEEAVVVHQDQPVQIVSRTPVYGSFIWEDIKPGYFKAYKGLEQTDTKVVTTNAAEYGKYYKWNDTVSVYGWTANTWVEVSNTFYTCYNAVKGGQTVLNNSMSEKITKVLNDDFEANIKSANYYSISFYEVASGVYYDSKFATSITSDTINSFNRKSDVIVLACPFNSTDWQVIDASVTRGYDGNRYITGYFPSTCAVVVLEAQNVSYGIQIEVVTPPSEEPVKKEEPEKAPATCQKFLGLF